MIRRLSSARRAFTLRSFTALAAICSVFSAVSIATACDPVVYLFRHAEEQSAGKLENTLLLVGRQHAELYPSMIQGFEDNNCPVSWVYAMSSYSKDGSIGTTNPYYTAYPLASVLPQGKPQDVINGQKLFEYLPGEQQLFLDDLKSKLKNGQGSVAVFWSSQGMCTIAQTLGSSLPDFDCVDTKPPRNSVFVFEYNANNQTFTRTGNFLQCFNFIPFAQGALEDKFSFDFNAGFSTGFEPAQYYCPPGGNLANNGAPAYKSVFGTTGDKKTNPPTPAANGIITQPELSTLLRGQICDLDNLQDNCHL